MNIAIIGYGRMGKAVEKIALERKHSVITVDPIDPKANFKEINSDSIKNADVCIDFTVPTIALENAKKISSLGKNLVMGTTGWYDEMDEMKKSVQNIGFLWSGNFSIGMNVFFEIVRKTASIMNNLPEYDAAVYEIHHNQKKDSPGGSAQIIGKIITEEMDRKKKIVGNAFTERKPEPEELHVASVRCGSTPGVHTVIFDCPIDTIELKHTARGREGFALGAVMAAEFLRGKKGFYTIEDLMKTIVGGK